MDSSELSEPRALTHTYEHLQKLAEAWQSTSETEKFKSDMLSRDYNKVVAEIHEDAKRESLLQKTAKLRKLEEKQRRKDMRA